MPATQPGERLISVVKCLVTGATGVIGRPLCTALGEAGVDVIAVGGPSSHGADHHCDLARDGLPDAALQDVDVVVHCAAVAHRSADPAQYAALNHRAVVALADAAGQAGVAHFIFISSVKAMGPGSGLRGVDDVNEPRNDPYGHAKWCAEQDLRKLDSAMAITVLRPALVLGPELRGNLHLMRRAQQLGVPAPPAGGRRSVVTLPDLVAALSALAQQPASGVRTFIASHPQPVSARQLYLAVARARSGWPGLPLPLPRWVWRMACAAADRRRQSGAEPLADMLFGEALFDGSALWQAMAYRPGGNPLQALQPVEPLPL